MKPVALSSHLGSLEAVFSTDIWDLRRIPGARYPACGSKFLLNFSKIPAAFRPLIKRYLRLLVVQYADGHCRSTIRYLRVFCTFLLQKGVASDNFCPLMRSVIEDYMIYLKTSPSDLKNQRTTTEVNTALSTLQRFLEYLERADIPEAPELPVGKLMWPTDIERWPTYQNERTIKYIPEFVLQQLDQALPDIRPTSFPVAVVLRASGWRISDVLNLRYNKCLEKTESGWWLCGDIAKIHMLNHRVPISQEIAAFIQAQCAYVTTRYAPDENPACYLFPSPGLERRGLPMHYETVLKALNHLAQKHGIQDESGAIFYFRTHAFRHTKAVELINNGMSLLLVQKWLAHASPEMTLVYAKLLEPTMRKAWEEAFAQGAVRIDDGGMPQHVASVQRQDENTIEWEYLRHNLDAVRLPNGYCFKPKKADCPTQATPCYSCHHFCTTPAFLPQFEHEEREMRQLIDMGEQVGSIPWVERNRQKLDKLVPVIQVLREGKLHHPAGKAIREYTFAEKDQRHGA